MVKTADGQTDMADPAKDHWLNRYLKGLKLADHVYSDERIRWGNSSNRASIPALALGSKRSGLP